ncbi:protein of unknown function [Muriicola jejuensis]|uniref:DUF4251 domain-containing protein n=1 Tax=Muriicola jejuensis TaxID=504488 RepID=A0A6P0UDG5_9FLAO|nr:DUF4251 domain-containing protein [Muriicola jejuensis]NER11311.1 DUF4251 domain-containing protein [Muriicola jejuensis]SMP21513.1 protein of unknown function [Muriicola jejuensis]
MSCAVSSKRTSAGDPLLKLEEKLTTRSYRIEANWAFPLMTQGITQVVNSGLLLPGSNANSINLMGNANYFRVEGDSVMIALPYFGERQIGGGYGARDVGIAFEGIPLSYKWKKEEKRERMVVEIEVRDRIETLVFKLFLFPSGKADINVNSSHRSSIRYSGEMIPVAESEH